MRILLILLFVAVVRASPLHFELLEQESLTPVQGPSDYEQLSLQTKLGTAHILYGTKSYFPTVKPSARSLLTSYLKSFIDLSRNLDPKRLKNPAAPLSGLEFTELRQKPLQWTFARLPLLEKRYLLAAVAMWQGHPIYVSALSSQAELASLLKRISLKQPTEESLE